MSRHWPHFSIKQTKIKAWQQGCTDTIQSLSALERKGMCMKTTADIVVAYGQAVWHS